MGRDERIWDDGLNFLTLDAGVCNHCRHINDGGITCRAFPDGIPAEILHGEVDHLKPYEGDGGIRYQPFENKGG